MERSRRVAIHLGVGDPRVRADALVRALVPADVASISLHLTYGQFARLAVDDAVRLCRRLGVSDADQVPLLEDAATIDALRGAVVHAAARLDPTEGLLILSFAGHGRRAAGGLALDPDAGWVLFDEVIPEHEIASLFDELPPGVAGLVIGDHCFGFRSLAGDRRSAPSRSLMSISAIDEDDVRILTRRTLAAAIETALFVPTPCGTARVLAERLQAQPGLDPEVWCSDATSWDRPPFT